MTNFINNSHNPFIFINNNIINTNEYLTKTKNNNTSSITNIINIIKDRGFTLGDGIFETILSYNNNIPFFEKHWNRLTTSLKYLNIKLNKQYNKNFIFNIIQELIILNKNIQKSSYLGIKIIVTRGVGPRSIEPLEIFDYQPNIIIHCFEIDSINNIKFIPKSLFLLDNLKYKINQYSDLVKIKSLNYLDKILAKRHAINNNFDDGLFVNLNDNITEATTSNIFIALDNHTIVTPKLSDGVLPGITRDFFINILTSNKINIITQSINIDHLKNNKINNISINNIFITNSIMGLCPVYKINNNIYNINQELIKKLSHLFINHFIEP